MKKTIATPVIILSIGLCGCMTVPQHPVRPVLACDDCKGLVYYGPQLPPQDAPGVAMARVLTGGLVKIAQVGLMVDAVKSTSETIADAGKYTVAETSTSTSTTITPADPVVVNQPPPVVVQQPPPTVVTQPEPIIVRAGTVD